MEMGDRDGGDVLGIEGCMCVHKSRFAIGGS